MRTRSSKLSFAIFEDENSLGQSGEAAKQAPLIGQKRKALSNLTTSQLSNRSNVHVSISSDIKQPKTALQKPVQRKVGQVLAKASTKRVVIQSNPHVPSNTEPKKQDLRVAGNIDKTPDASTISSPCSSIEICTWKRSSWSPTSEHYRGRVSLLEGLSPLSPLSPLPPSPKVPSPCYYFEEADWGGYGYESMYCWESCESRCDVSLFNFDGVGDD